PPGPPGSAGPSGSAAKPHSLSAATVGRTAAAAVGAGPPGAPGPPGPPGSPGKAGLDGVGGFEIVTAKMAVPKGQSATEEGRCPTGKVALGGGVLPDPESPHTGSAPEDRMEAVVSAPLLAGGADSSGYGWRATVRNTAGGPLSLGGAALCVRIS